MLIGKLSAREDLRAQYPAICRALDHFSPETASAGVRIELGDGAFYSVSEYTTRAAASVMEAHRKYADIHIILENKERILAAPLSSLKLVTPYDEASDVAFYEIPAEYEEYILHAGDFLVLFPEDAHCPGLAPNGKPAPVRKAVVKLPV